MRLGRRKECLLSPLILAIVPRGPRQFNKAIKRSKKKHKDRKGRSRKQSLFTEKRFLHRKS